MSIDPFNNNNMLFAKGTKVKLKYSNEEGIITEFLDNGMVKVRLSESGIEIPIFPEGLEGIFDSQKTKAKVVPAKQAKEKPAPPPVEIDSPYTVLKNRGIQLAFDPVFQGDDVPEKYLIHLINDTSSDIIYQVNLKIAGEQEFKKMGKLDKMSTTHLGDLFYDELSDNPALDLDCCRITTDGTGSRHLKTVKIKPKQFFKNIATAPIINRKVHLYQVFDNLKAERKDKQEEDLKVYTQKAAQYKAPPKDANPKFWSHDIQAKAAFKNELDLHIEELVDDYEGLNNSEILQIQIRTFEEYIEEALKLGVDRVFIIHGVGKGKLKNAIATKLIQMRFIKTFKNEWHHKYGWGATEVIFD